MEHGLWPEHPAWTPRFDAFRANAAIKRIADEPRWSISDANKRPLDVDRLEYERMADRGASPSNPGCLRTLDQMRLIVPNAANYAYALDSASDGLLVLDIEPSCPAGLRDRLLGMEGALYAERSLSGEGLHVLFEPEEWMDAYPNAQVKTKLQVPDRTFEVLRQHWVTFTMEAVELPGSCVSAQALLEPLYAAATETAARTHGYSVADLEGIPDAGYLVGVICDLSSFRKSPADYHGDMSKFEAAFLFHHAHALKQHLCTDRIRRNGHDYAFDERVAILAAIAERGLEHRDKHETMRGDLSYLEYECVRALDDYEAKHGSVEKDER